MRSRLSRKIKRTLARWPSVYLRAHRGFDFARWVVRRPHERDFEFYRYAPPAPSGRLFLDVGAYTGTSALCFRMYDKRTPILSIEPNVTMKPYLERVRRLIHGFDYRLVAAGDESGEVTLYVPCYRGSPISGEASLHRPTPEGVWWIQQNVGELRPGEFSVIEQRVPVVPLDDLALSPAQVKIDVEGLEFEVLRGLRRTLTEYRPTILVERSEQFEALSAWLRTVAGYEPMSWDRNEHRLVPLDPASHSQNVFFAAVP